MAGGNPESASSANPYSDARCQSRLDVYHRRTEHRSAWKRRAGFGPVLGAMRLRGPRVHPDSLNCDPRLLSVEATILSCSIVLAPDGMGNAKPLCGFKSRNDAFIPLPGACRWHFWATYPSHPERGCDGGFRAPKKREEFSKNPLPVRLWMWFYPDNL